MYVRIEVFVHKFGPMITGLFKVQLESPRLVRVRTFTKLRLATWSLFSLKSLYARVGERKRTSVKLVSPLENIACVRRGYAT
jgi:hypothetical protein